jgi:hypothetical protein
VGRHGGHDPLLGAAGADDPEPDEPDEPDEPVEPEEPDEPDAPEEPEDDDAVVVGAALVTEPPAAGATWVPAAGTYRSVTRVTYGRCRSSRPAGRFPAFCVGAASSSPAGVSWVVSDAATPASQPVAVSAPAAPSPVTVATASRPRSRSLLV